MTLARPCLVLLTALLGLSCREGRNAFPSTELGRIGRDWLAAHNRGEGHAQVHFTMENRGTAPMSGAQMDSTVYAGVELARRLGPLVPVTMMYSSDTALMVVLRSADSSMWSARFTPVPQPGLTKVSVEVTRVRLVRDAKITLLPDPKPR